MLLTCLTSDALRLASSTHSYWILSWLSEPFIFAFRVVLGGRTRNLSDGIVFAASINSAVGQASVADPELGDLACSCSVAGEDPEVFAPLSLGDCDPQDTARRERMAHNNWLALMAATPEEN
jgi:hypothetical protein